MTTPLVILDADGVFLDERPYWNAALGAALDLSGLADRAEGRWDALADYAYGPIGIHRVPKTRGLNSNWDLAALLTRVLQDSAWQIVVGDFLEADREYDAMHSLGLAASHLFEMVGADRDTVRVGSKATENDPLLAAGIDRNSDFYAEVVERFQEVLEGRADIEWRFDPWQLKESIELTGKAFDTLTGMGWQLRVCTSRDRDEIEAPLRALGLRRYFEHDDQLTTASEVRRAERSSGRSPLGKPHWFPAACARVGYDHAVDMLDEGTAPEDLPACLYVGDALADFQSVQEAGKRSLDIGYVHMRSGVTTREQERELAGSDPTIAVIELLEHIPRVIREVLPESS